jgi:putative intracellular protease/amidase
MKPDDPRHGKKSGYNEHYRDGERPCQPCIEARYYARKRVIGDQLRGERMFYTSAEVNELVAPWLTMGLTLGAISVAAQFGSQRGTRLREVLLTEGNTVRRGTYHRLAAVTEADFAPDAKVYADLTRTRVYSLMAIGHRQIDLPINPGGHWRTRTHTTVETARNVREFYAAHEFAIGPCAHTLSRARHPRHTPPKARESNL